MGRLAPAQLTGRLALDWRVLIRVATHQTLREVRAFASRADLDAGRDLAAADAAAGRATHYLVTYASPFFTAPGVRGKTATACFDLTAGGNYPFTAPAVTFVGRP